jgi:hypothetical protein
LVAVFAFAGSSLVEVGGVGVAPTGDRDIEQIAGGALAEHGVAGVGGSAFGRMHGGGVTQSDVFEQIFIVEDGAGPVAKTLGDDAIGGCVDRGNPPSVAVANGIHLPIVGLTVSGFTT